MTDNTLNQDPKDYMTLLWKAYLMSTESGSLSGILVSWALTRYNEKLYEVYRNISAASRKVNKMYLFSYGGLHSWKRITISNEVCLIWRYYISSKLTKSYCVAEMTTMTTCNERKITYLISIGFFKRYINWFLRQYRY